MARPIPEPPPLEDLPLAPEALMAPALDQARLAADSGEAPIGAALYSPGGGLLALAHNMPIAASDPTAHAEVLCLRQAARSAGNYRLPGTILAVTLEPCIMCVGALIHARVAGVVYGADDPKSGALRTHLRGNALAFANHKFWVLGGVLARECSSLLTEFFRARR